MDKEQRYSIIEQALPDIRKTEKFKAKDLRELLITLADILAVPLTSEALSESLENIAKLDVDGKIIVKKPGTFAVVRNVGGAWGFIDDAGHERSSNVTTIETINDDNFNFAVKYDPVAKVGSLVATPDETYAKRGLFLGASVGLDVANYAVYKQGFGAYCYQADGNSFWCITGDSVSQGGEIAGLFDPLTGKLTISHPKQKIVDDVFNVSVSRRWAPTHFTPVLDAVGVDTITLYFKDAAGNTVMNVHQDMKFYFARNGMYKVTNDRLAIAGSNFWLLGS